MLLQLGDALGLLLPLSLLLQAFPRLEQRIGNVAAEFDDLVLNVLIARLAGAIVPPIEVLAILDNLEHRILLPRAVVQLANPDVEDGKYQVVAAELLFARQERFELEGAVRAGNHSRRYDRNEKCRLIDRLRYGLLPQGAVRDGEFVLPKTEIVAFAAELRGQLALDGGAKFRQHFIEVFVVLARIAEESGQAF